VDNITRPSLVEKWEPSPDLKTWTLRLRRTVKWHNGRQFTADDVVWNLKRVLDPKTGSSVVGLMKGFLLEDVETGEKDDKGNPKKSSRLWDANAIQKVDDFTVRLHGKSAQLAVPEQLFHYPLLIVDPAENGEFKVGSNGTGAFTLTANEVGRKQVLKARKEGYWGGGPHLDQLEFIDLGDDPAASVSALASKQVDGLYGADIVQLEALQKIPHVQMYQVATAYTATARMQPVKPFDDKRVRQAMRYAIDSNAVLQIAHRGLGQPGEHHHVSSVHPEYAKLAPLSRDVAKAKKLLAEAGYPNGIDVEIICRPQPAWELLAVQTMVEQWKEAGIRVKINVMPSTQYWEVWTKVPFGFTTWAHRPLGIMSLALAYRSGGPWNESKYSNPEFDRLLSQAEGTLDVAARREIMARLEAILQDDGPIVQPVWRSIFTFHDKRVQGFRAHPTLYIFGHQLAIQA
jgi:peptide/nickel transport system substrate-binding protein